MKFRLKGTMASKVLVLAGGTAFAQGLLIAASPILTRLYSPEDFGMLALYISILSLCAAIVSLRYETAITLPKLDSVAVNLLVLSVEIALVMSVLLGLLLGLIGDKVFSYMNADGLQDYLWLLPLSLFGVGTYQALSYWALRKKAYTSIARTKVNQSVGQLVIQVSVGLLSLGKMGLLLGDVFGRMGGSGSLMTMLVAKDKAAIRSFSLKGMYAAMYEYRKFPFVSSGSAILNSVGLYVTPILMTMFYGPQVAGWMLLSQRVIGSPLDMVGQSVGQVYIGEGSHLIRENPGSLKRLYRTTAKRLLLLGLLPVVSLAFTGPWIFQLVFGSEWLEAGIYVQILAGMFLCKLVVVPLAETLTMLQKLKWKLAWDASRMVLVIGGQLAAHALHMTAIQAVLIYSVTMAVAYVALFVISSVALTKHAEVNQVNLVRGTIPS